MDKKLRSMADSVHGTIYLSEFESEMINTPFFYRLHDIYQSSTVYLTFPSNRTKRYEHSCGTMNLAGELFFSAITNADSASNRSSDSPKPVDDFFRDLNIYTDDIFKRITEKKQKS